MEPKEEEKKDTVKDDESGEAIQVDQITAMMEEFGELSPEKKDEKKDPDHDDEDDDKDNKDGSQDDGKDQKDDKQDDKQDDKAPTELDLLKQKIDELTKRLEEKEKAPEKKEDDNKDDVEIDETKLSEQVINIQKDLPDYVASDEEFDKLIEDRGKMNTMLKKVQADGMQAILRIIPKVVNSLVTQQTIIVQKTSEFYAEHKDLKEHGKEVGKIIDETHSKNPDWTLDKILEFVGGKGDDIGEVRRRLKLQKNAEKKASDANEQNRRIPNTDRAAHVRTPGDKKLNLTGIEKEIDQLLELE